MIKRKTPIVLAGLVLLVLWSLHRVSAIEIPLETVAPARIGYVDLQKVFDTYPEKAFAEGDLLKEIERRKRDLSRRQNDINLLRQQIAADQAVLDQAKAGQAVRVPANAVNEPEPVPIAPPAPVAQSTAAVQYSTSSAAATEPYPTDDPLAGLPGHTSASTVTSSTGSLPGMASAPAPKWPLLDQLAGASAPSVLTADGISQLQDRINVHQKALDRAIADFKGFRTNAIADMKQLQTQKTYGVMARIYATLQTVARDEGVTLVMDKAYVLYGEDSVDLSDKLIQRLQQESLP